MPKPFRKLPDLGLGEGADPELVEEGEDDAEPLTDDQLGLTAKPVNEVVRLDAHPPAVLPTKGRAGVRAYAQRFTVQAINALVKKLRDRDSRVVVAAATALLSRGWGAPSIEGKELDEGADTNEAAVLARLEAINRAQMDPEYRKLVLAIVQGSGIMPDPNAPLSPEVAAPTEEETIAQLIEEPAPDEPIEVEVTRDGCFCGCDYDEHPAGGQCNTCVRCHLYSPRSEALEHRRAIEDKRHE